MFVVNLAFCDFLMMLKSPIFLYNTFHRGFAAGHVGCQIFAFMGSLSGIGAGMSNAFIAYDRYNTITNPLEGKLSRTKAFFMIVFVWGYTLPWAILPLLEMWSRYVPGRVDWVRFSFTQINEYSCRGLPYVLHLRLLNELV